jgi:hypothetical protein
MPETLAPLVDRFWQRVQKTDSCWLWIGARKEPRRSQPLGYGRIVLTNAPLKYGYAHRLSWEINVGKIPKGKKVLHKCDNPPCVNPDHLFLGTQLDNMKDCVSKRRKAVGHRNGRSLLTEDEVKDIRIRLARGESTRNIARIYGRGKSTIWSISARLNWAHL